MRVRITKPPPTAYGNQHRSLRVGRLYDLDSAIASALIVEGCAELDDALTPDERRERERRLRAEIWEASDRTHAQQWMLPKPDSSSNLSE
jgi:hypothetical protein